MMCGNRQLSYQLGPNGGVNELHLDFEPWQNFTWLPVVLMFAKLRSFTCYLKYNYLEYLVNDVQLDWLSSGLQELALEFPNVFEQLLQPPIDYASKPAEELRSLAKFYDFGAKFPALESLSLSGMSYVFESLFDKLPTNLTHLNVRGQFFEVSEKIVDKLPRTLWHLTLETTARLEREGDTKCSAVNFPPRLEECHLSVSWCISAVPYLPQTIKALSLNNYDISRTPYEWKDLPKELLSLTTPVGFRFSPEWLTWLPPTIENLQLGGLHAIDESVVKYLPPKLAKTSLKISKLPSNLFSLLPRTLQVIDDSSSTASQSREGSSIDDLPPATTHLTYRGTIESQSVSKLPHRILHLTTFGLNMDLPDPNLMLLPHGLQMLKVQHGHWSAEATKSLASLPHLNTLHFSYSHVHQGGHVHLQSSNIQTMTISCQAPNGQEIDFSVLPFPSTLTSLHIEHTPKEWILKLGNLVELRALVINFASTTTVDATEEFFESLPRTLQVLNCPIGNDLSVECLRKMPPELYYMNLSGSLPSKTMLTNENVAEFPKYLRRIVIPSSPHLNAGCRDYFTPFLSTLTEHYSTFKRKQKNEIEDPQKAHIGSSQGSF
jgi:hypothetical protein